MKFEKYPFTVIVAVMMYIILTSIVLGYLSLKPRTHGDEGARVIEEHRKTGHFIFYVVRLDDGSRCAVTDYGNAIDCDWLAEKRVEQ